MVVNRGEVSVEDLATFLDAGYEEKHILGVITAIGVKTMSNYMNHITQTPVDDVFEGHSWSK
jgi:alkylhydroperoxidase family enzyme